jgi:hypothetical protein
MNISARVTNRRGDAPEEKVLVLMRYTDTVWEIHNTLRSATPVILSECDACEVRVDDSSR